MSIAGKDIRLLVAGRQFGQIVEYLEAFIPGVRVNMADPLELLDYIEDTHILIPAAARIAEDVFSSANKLKLVQQWGSNLDGVAVDAASRRGIPVANVPSAETGSADSVAEWCVMTAICLSRHIQDCKSHGVIGKDWSLPLGRILFGRTAGLIGIGDTGRALAARLRAFGMRIAAIRMSSGQVSPKEPDIEEIGDRSKLPRLLSMSDYLFIMTPLTESTRHMIGQDELSFLPYGAMIINPSAAAIIEQEAMKTALNQGGIGGISMDTYWEDAPEPDDPFLTSPRTLVTPNIAGVTDAAYERIASTVAENIRRAMHGKIPLYCVNKHAAAKLRH